MMEMARFACVLGSLSVGQAFRNRHRLQRLPELPSQPIGVDVVSDDRWWVQDEEKTYFQPSVDKQALSQQLSDYYYAIGSTSALSAKHKQHRVGGTGKVHIFHMSRDDAISLPALTQSRGKALSGLQTLTAGARLGRFPAFELPADYQDPLEDDALATERQVMAGLTEASYKNFLYELTNSSSSRLTVTTRNTDAKDGTKQVVGYLEREFEATGVTTCVHSFQIGRWWSKRDIFNVVGFVQGTEPGSVTLGAHFDDLPIRNAPGAEDNGSGSAAVLSALKAFMASRAIPKKSIYFVAFGGEEQGLIGSKHFADELNSPGSANSPIPEACRVAKTKDHTAFTMDMIGYRNPSFSDPTVLIETKSWAKSVVANALGMSNRVNNAGGITLLYSSRPFGSDHMSFLNKNLPASLTIDNDGDTSKYPCYHKSCDSMEYIDTAFASATAKLNLGAVLRVAGLN